jgi:creatinine amidohydrolase/Fe(II)-dependent formamide hydrolase-like protein
MLEQHGPHLPVGADTLGVTSRRTARQAVSARRCPNGTSS